MRSEEPPLRVHPVSVVLGRVNSAGTANASQTVRAFIKNPSRRLSCSISLTFEPDTLQDPSSYASAAWSMTCRRINPVTNKPGKLHAVFSGSALPELYEVDTAVRVLEVAATLTIPTDGSGTKITGNWVLLVEWEPNQDLQCLEEAEQLFALCDATGPSTPAVLV